jgi:hypothetical protein
MNFKIYTIGRILWPLVSPWLRWNGWEVTQGVREIAATRDREVRLFIRSR